MTVTTSANKTTNNYETLQMDLILNVAVPVFQHENDRQCLLADVQAIFNMVGPSLTNW